MNNIIAEIHRVREKQAAECDYDVHKMGERMRQRQREEISHGVRYARLKRDAKFAEAYEQERRVWELGQVLAKARENAGLTQEALAKKMGTTRSAVCRYERQPTNLKISTLEKVARAMGRKLVVKLA